MLDKLFEDVDVERDATVCIMPLEKDPRCRWARGHIYLHPQRWYCMTSSLMSWWSRDGAWIDRIVDPI